MQLFSWFILRRLGREPLRSTTTILGIALGIAVIVAIRLTNASSIAGFKTAVDIVSGQTSLELVGAGVGIDEALLPDLVWLREHGDISPVIEGDFRVRLPGRPPETLRVLGVDILRDQPFREYRLLEWEGGRTEPSAQEFLRMLRDPQAAILTARFAEANGLRLGSTLEVAVGDRSLMLTVQGLLRNEGPARVLDGNFVLMDIAAAQQALDRFGRVDRIDIRLADPTRIEAAEADIAARLPASLTVQRPARRGRQVENMLSAFHGNLTALSYIALLVGLFLVYNTVAVAVIARRSEIGLLRAIGVSRARIRVLFLAEAAGLAAVGSGVGLLVGRLLADGAVGLTSATVTTLYIADAAAPPALDWTHAALAFGIAVPLSLVAALLPANEAARVPPTAAIGGTDRLDSRPPMRSRLSGTAIALLIAGAWLATRAPLAGLPLFGYLAALAIVFGASFLVPEALRAMVTALRHPVRRLLTVEPRLAVANLSAAIPRLSISVAALAVALSMMVALALMIGSFRETVVYWVGQTLQADLFITPGAGRAAGREQTLSRSVVDAIETSPDVAAIDRFRNVDMPYRDTIIRVGAGDFTVLLAHGSLLFKTPADPTTARAAMRGAIGDDAVVASESFGLRYRVTAGDLVELPTPSGPRPFRVAAVYYDYSSDRGVVVMDRGTFAKHFGEQAPTNLSVYLKPGVSSEEARETLLARIGHDHRLLISTNASLRGEVLRIFDATFTITYALEVIAILVAILGIAGTLLTLILERQHEFMTLRLLGADRRQVRRVVIAEAVLIGGVSQGVGIAVGFALSLILVYVVNVQSFGWTIQFRMPWAFLVQSTMLTLVASAVAALYPARRAVQLSWREAE